MTFARRKLWWRQAIFRAIDGALSCVFILSPEFAASEMCREETEYARDQNKRLILCCSRKSVTSKLPQILADVQRFDFLSEENFDVRLDELLEAIDTDPESVPMQRLLVEARHWKLAKS